ncbi:hypothetical protein PCANC_13727 [Puccinia coronata f. sp. avenae]|uniref:Uncharacterized protein n=2 Tax=Puccinia coronata f. sp. avenae TaxID=200324 RepID=A0A2N5VFM5_9BASI|nr:hypothetical protein PCANC_13727 [Puccinia coronata f. sp. avenae]
MVSTRSNRRPAGKNSTQPQNQTTRGGRGRRSNSGQGRGRGGLAQRGRRQSTKSNEGIQQQQQSSTPQDYNLTPSVSSFTLENHESQLDVWSEKQLLDVLSKQTNQFNCIPPKVQEALRFHKMSYTKFKLMLALIGNVLAKLVNSWLGDIGKAWRALSEQKKEVFKAKVFQHFSKLPIPDDPDEEDDDNDKTDTFQATISHEEELIYQPLYQKLVNHNKVNLLLVQKDDGPDPKSKTEKQVINHINRVNSKLLDFLEVGDFAKNYPTIRYGLELHKIAGSPKEILKPTVMDGLFKRQWKDSEYQRQCKKAKKCDETRINLRKNLNIMLCK